MKRKKTKTLSVIMPEKIMTARELARHLRVPESVILKLAEDCKIPGSKIGESWWFWRSEISEIARKAKNIK